MKKFLPLTVLVALVGCGEKKPLTPEEQWHGYCTSMGNAARSILLDRQNGIQKTQAVEHANKIEEPFTKTFILSIVEQVYALPQQQVTNKPDAIREQIRTEVTQKCLVTPHDKVPNYKQF